MRRSTSKGGQHARRGASPGKGGGYRKEGQPNYRGAANGLRSQHADPSRSTSQKGGKGEGFEVKKKPQEKEKGDVTKGNGVKIVAYNTGSSGTVSERGMSFAEMLRRSGEQKKAVATVTVTRELSPPPSKKEKRRELLKELEEMDTEVPVSKRPPPVTQHLPTKEEPINWHDDVDAASKESTPLFAPAAARPLDDLDLPALPAPTPADTPQPLPDAERRGRSGAPNGKGTSVAAAINGSAVEAFFNFKRTNSPGPTSLARAPRGIVPAEDRGREARATARTARSPSGGRGRSPGRSPSRERAAAMYDEQCDNVVLPFETQSRKAAKGLFSFSGDAADNAALATAPAPVPPPASVPEPAPVRQPEPTPAPVEPEPEPEPEPVAATVKPDEPKQTAAKQDVKKKKGKKEPEPPKKLTKAEKRALKKAQKLAEAEEEEEKPECKVEEEEEEGEEVEGKDAPKEHEHPAPPEKGPSEKEEVPQELKREQTRSKSVPLSEKAADAPPFEPTSQKPFNRANWGLGLGNVHSGGSSHLGAARPAALPPPPTPPAASMNFSPAAQPFYPSHYGEPEVQISGPEGKKVFNRSGWGNQPMHPPVPAPGVQPHWGVGPSVYMGRQAMDGSQPVMPAPAGSAAPPAPTSGVSRNMMGAELNKPPPANTSATSEPPSASPANASQSSQPGIAPTKASSTPPAQHGVQSGAVQPPVQVPVKEPVQPLLQPQVSQPNLQPNMSQSNLSQPQNLSQPSGHLPWSTWVMGPQVNKDASQSSRPDTGAASASPSYFSGAANPRAPMAYGYYGSWGGPAGGWSQQQAFFAYPAQPHQQQPPQQQPQQQPQGQQPAMSFPYVAGARPAQPVLGISVGVPQRNMVGQAPIVLPNAGKPNFFGKRGSSPTSHRKPGNDPPASGQAPGYGKRGSSPNKRGNSPQKRGNSPGGKGRLRKGPVLGIMSNSSPPATDDPRGTWGTALLQQVGQQPRGNSPSKKKRDPKNRRGNSPKGQSAAVKRQESEDVLVVQVQPEKQDVGMLAPALPPADVPKAPDSSALAVESSTSTSSSAEPALAEPQGLLTAEPESNQSVPPAPSDSQVRGADPNAVEQSQAEPQSEPSPPSPGIADDAQPETEE